MNDYNDLKQSWSQAPDTDLSKDLKNSLHFVPTDDGIKHVHKIFLIIRTTEAETRNAFGLHLSDSYRIRRVSYC